jgi:hypothetical protein
MSILNKTLGLLALIAVAVPAQAQRHPGLRVQLTRAPSNNGSDNTGPNVGSSSGTTGDTFHPPGNSGNGASGGAPASGGGTPNSAGVTVTSNGNVSGGVTTPVNQIVAGLQNGSLTLTTAGGGSITVSLPPSVGGAVANAMSNPSSAAGTAAAGEVAVMLSASNLPGGVVNSVSDAVAAVGGAYPTAAVPGTISQAVSAVRNALSAGSVTPDAAKGLIAVLVALRAAAATR